MLQMAGKHWQSRISTLRVLSRSGSDDGVDMLGRPHLARQTGTWNRLASHPGSEGRVRLKPVGQGQGRDMASSMIMLGKGSATAGLSGRWWAAKMGRALCLLEMQTG